MTPERALSDGLMRLGLENTPGLEKRLWGYVALLEKWNRVYNLTALRDPQQMVTHHLLDALVMLPYVRETKTLADIGSGGGIPGIPLALALPRCQITLVESNQKKSTFLVQARIVLELENVEVVNQRAESVQPEKKFDAVISRAFSSLANFVLVARHWAAPGGKLFAMKGGYPREEIAALPKDILVEGVESLRVPGLGAERHLVVMRVN